MDLNPQKPSFAHNAFIIFIFLSHLSSSFTTQDHNILLQSLTNSFKSVWNTSENNTCHWLGVTCDRSRRVINLTLSGLRLTGDIPSAIGLLQSLSTLDLSRNAFAGNIPYELSNCTSLSSLNLSWNHLAGSIPNKFQHLQRLQILDLSYNQLSGVIPDALGNLQNLLQLHLSSNSLSGSIPDKLQHLQRLQILDLSYNQLTGIIPDGLGNLQNLLQLHLSSNSLFGPIPDSFSKLDNISSLSLSQNNLSGSIPAAIGNLSNLSVLSAYGNYLEGQIPLGVNTGKLTTLNLASNKLNGTIAVEICASGQLQVLILSANKLSGTLPEELGSCSSLSNFRVGSNSLTGNIPLQYGQLKKLTYFEADRNYLTGKIPSTISGWSSLALLNLANNNLFGDIPMELIQISALQELLLSGNRLTGEIPKGLSKLKSLSRLDLSSNGINGSIPLELCESPKLEYLLLQNNFISGSIPGAIGNCTQLLQLQLGGNRLNGNIPREIGSLMSLQIGLNLSWNELGGSIPSTLGLLTKLVSLDLSHNYLSGVIPASLGNMMSILDLNFSSNNLTGQVPHSSIFSKSPNASFANNSGLCGLPLWACGNEPIVGSNTARSRKASVSFWEVAGIASSCAIVALVVIAIVAYFAIWKHQRTSAIDPTPSLLVSRIFVEKYEQAINFESIKEATQSSVNAISSNHFSTIYRAIMPSGLVLAAKKLHSADKGVAIHQRRMIQELEKLSKLYHANVMRPIGYVLHGDLTILFYDVVPLCSLAQQLHRNPETILDWPARYSIALGVAHGLAFLHHYCHPPMIHMDITANNIFLGSCYEVQIGDVEIAKLVDPTKNTGSITAVAGSFGYIAPEYAFTMQVSMATNVYSFGVVLFELITGRLPVDETFGEGRDLVRWVQEAPLRGETPELILDERISTCSFTFRQEMLAVLKLALLCTNASPSRRPRMKRVVEILLDAQHFTEANLAAK